MIKTLTEQWRDGTLERGYYYYKTKVGVEVIGYQCFGLKFPYDYNHNTIDSVEEVLGPVPGYMDYKELLRHSELSRNLVYEVLVNQKEYNKLLDKAKEYKRLQERLEIATKALNGIRDVWANNPSKFSYIARIANRKAKTALEEMEGVK